MYRMIVASMHEDVLSYERKGAIASQLFKILEKYFYNEGYGSPSPRVSYSQYDIKEYTFRVGSGTYDRNVKYVASTDRSDMNEFRKEVRAFLKQCGFTKVTFDISSEKREGSQNTGYYSPTVPVYQYKIFNAIYFAE